MLIVNLNSRIVNPAPTVASVNWDVVPAEPVVEVDISPYRLGMLDAECGERCLPELYYTQDGAKMEYVEGFESVAGETLLSAQAREIWYAAEAADLEEDRLDREWHARGMW